MMQDKCLICFGDVQNGISLFDYVSNQDCICGVCRNKFEVANTHIQVGKMKVYALYYYNDFFEDMMFRLKESRDIALASIFLKPFINKLKKQYRGYTFIYAPSSIEKTKIRGFHALEALFNFGFPCVHLFEKTQEYKQSQQEYHQRTLVKAYIVRNKVPLSSRKIVLIDDMCTSGSTLLAMYELLEKEDVTIKVFTIAINKKLHKAKLKVR